MMNGNHSWGRSYDPPGYRCRDCSVLVPEKKIREAYSRGAVDCEEELEAIIGQGECPRDQKWNVYE